MHILEGMSLYYIHMYVRTYVYYNKSHHYVMLQPMECPSMCSVHVCGACVCVCACVCVHQQTKQKYTSHSLHVLLSLGHLLHR